MDKKAFYKKVARANRLIQSTYKHFNTPDRRKKGHSVLDKIEQSINILYKDKAKGLKFYTPRNAPEKELKRIENALDMVINSPYTTARGRRNLQKRIEGTLKEKFDIEQKDLETLLDVFDSEAYEKVREMLDGDSSQAVDIINSMIKEGNSASSIIDNLSSYIKNNNDMNIREWADNVLDTTGN